MEVARVPGVAIAVVGHGRLIWQHHAGVMDPKTGNAVSAETLWPAASLGKPVFALAALRLVDEGKLALDAPLKSYLPDYAPADVRGDRITARHVLSHSSGLRNWRESEDDRLVPDFEPGSRFQYSGEAYYYLQRVVEHITGSPFEQFMEQSIFAPLGMESSTYSWRADTASRVVAGYDGRESYTVFWKDIALRLLQEANRQKRELASFTSADVLSALRSLTPAPRTLPEFLIPNAAASLLTTASDYGAFLNAVLDPDDIHELKRRTRDAMFTPQIRVSPGLDWGLGWGIESARGRTNYIWQWGDNGSWKNFVLAHPASRSGVLVFTNGSHGLNVAQRIVTAATGLDHEAFWWL